MKVVTGALLLVISGCTLHPREPVVVQVDALGEGALQQLRNLDDTAPGALAARPPGAALQRVSSTSLSDPLTDPLPNSLTDPLSEAVAQMVQQLSVGLRDNRIRRLPMAVLPFVALADPGAQTAIDPLGERVAENFLYQLQRAEYNLIDYRALSLTTTEKAPLSRQNLSALYSRNRIYFVLTGTYARYPDGIVLNARVLDTTTRQVLASAQTHVPDARLEGAWPGYDSLQALDSGMIIENGRGPVGLER
jgi:TolB-like protein